MGSDRKKTIEEIARRVLDIKTLETRKRDSLDFHDLAVWTLEEALREAYMAGFTTGWKAGLDRDVQAHRDALREEDSEGPVTVAKGWQK